MSHPNPYKQTEVEKLAGTVNGLISWAAVAFVIYWLLSIFGVRHEYALLLAVFWPPIGASFLFVAAVAAYVVLLPAVYVYKWFHLWRKQRAEQNLAHVED